MPMATVSHTVVRSVSIDRHEDPDRVEKFVRYISKYSYQVETDYVQVAELDLDAVMDPSNIFTFSSHFVDLFRHDELK